MIPAIILAAGLSRRMGRFKLALPWGETTVIGQVVATLETAGLTDIFVVTGHRADDVSAILKSSIVRIVFNPHYAAGEMLSTIKMGLGALRENEARHPELVLPPGSAPFLPPSAALLCLGDQPQMEVATVRAVLTAGAEDRWTRIVLPSYQLRAGHPILLPVWLWPEILACTTSLRDVLARHRDQTRYLNVDTPSILADLDTPEDYRAGEQRLVDGKRELIS